MKNGFVFSFAFVALTCGVVSACSDDSNVTPQSPDTGTTGSDAGGDSDSGMGSGDMGGSDMDMCPADVTFPDEALLPMKSDDGQVNVAVRTATQPPGGGPNCMELTVTDSDGKPMAGVHIDFVAVCADEGAVDADGNPKKGGPSSCDTDENGKCTGTLRLPMWGMTWKLDTTFCTGAASCTDNGAVQAGHAVSSTFDTGMGGGGDMGGGDVPNDALVTAKGEKVTVDVRTNPQPPGTGPNGVELTVTDSDGKPMAGVHIDFVAVCADEGAVDADGNPKKGGPSSCDTDENGKCTGTLRLPMWGKTWKLDTTFCTGAASCTDPAAVQVDHAVTPTFAVQTAQ